MTATALEILELLDFNPALPCDAEACPRPAEVRIASACGCTVELACWPCVEAEWATAGRVACNRCDAEFSSSRDAVVVLGPIRRSP